MKLRAMTTADIDELREIHKRYFLKEFEFPSFFDGYLSSYVVTDDFGGIIAGGGVRPIAEAVVVTNKAFFPRKRREALLQVMQASMFIANIREFKQLHAFVQDDKWIEHLQKIGFRKSKGQTLVIGV